jgi:hypothetical protein
MDRLREDSFESNVEPAKPKPKKKKSRHETAKSPFGKMLKLIQRIPKKEWDKIPSDAGYNKDHCLYGAPKR